MTFSSLGLRPELARAVHRIALFSGLDESQASRVAAACGVSTDGIGYCWGNNAGVPPCIGN